LLSLMSRQQQHQQQQYQTQQQQVVGKAVVVNGRQLRLSLEQYDIKHSSKNLVLVGLRQS
jgi:hypothetical protein